MIHTSQPRRRLAIVQLTGVSTPGLIDYRPPVDPPPPPALPLWVEQTPWWAWFPAVAAAFYIAKELKRK